MYKLRLLWKKFKIKTLSKFINLFASQTNFDIENTTLIIGSTRSGTTFLMESLNSNNDFRIIFEPFNATYTKEWKSFGPRHYIDHKSPSQEEKEAVDNILRGKINNPWIDQYNRKIRSDRRLIKSVRSNLLVDYIQSEYPALRIIYIVRNPYKVVASRINLHFDPRDVDAVPSYKQFLLKYYPDIDVTELKSLMLTPESCHTALWCFENRYLMRSHEERDLEMLKYEDIIGKRISLKDNKIKRSKNKSLPSVTSSFQNAYQLSDKEIKNIDEVLKLFGLEEFINKKQH